MTLTPDWHKSMFSHTNGCVEVTHRAGYVVVRDSKDPDGPTVPFTPREWQEILDRRPLFGVDWTLFAPLQFTRRERLAFEDGARGGQFDLPDFCRYCGEQIEYRLGTWHHDRSTVVFRAHRPEPDRDRERAAGQATKAGQG